MFVFIDILVRKKIKSNDHSNIHIATSPSLDVFTPTMPLNPTPRGGGGIHPLE